MKLNLKIFPSLLLFACSLCSVSYAQMEEYNHKRELKGVSGQWHNIILPDEIFGGISQNLADIRIFGITASNDTIEAPYLLRLLREQISRKDVAFKTLNASHDDRGYYFTFEIPAAESINQIELDFTRRNFDWLITLEGSQDQKEWFTIVENYRVLSVKNELTDFQFTKLAFPDSKYRFFRILINSKEQPGLTGADISLHEVTEGTFRKYPIMKTAIKENKPSKQTEIDIELQLPVPVNHLKIDVKDTFDYYRPVTIQYVTDSLKTEQGWKYNYQTLASGTLHSLEENEFAFSSTTLKKLKILIHNQDNQPLTFGTIQAKGYVHELVGRFTEPAVYFLTYGNERAVEPHYDIVRFADAIPDTFTTLEVGDEQVIEKEKTPEAGPLFKNKIWLWAVMTVIIVVLGWFSVKMIKKDK